MAKKYFNWPVIGALFIGMILMANLNAAAYKDVESSGPAPVINTDKTDRTLIKEIRSNQMEMLSILKDIQARIK